MRKNVKWIAILLLSLSLLLFGACADGPAEEAGEEIDAAIEGTGDAFEEAGEDIDEAIDEAGDDLEEAGEEIEEAVEGDG